MLVLVALGSRGDIDPFIALGRALVTAGHRVRLVTQPEFAGDAGDAGIEVCGVDLGRVRDLLDLPEARQVVRNGHDPRAIRRLMRALAPGFEDLYRVTLAAADGATALLCHPMHFPALDVAQHLDLPAVHVYHVLGIPTRRLPSPGAHRLAPNLGAHGNRLSYAAERWLAWRLTAPVMNRLAGHILGRPALSTRRALALHERRRGAVAAVSPRVLPRPDDWPADVVLSGYLRTTHPATRPLDPATRRFLDCGPPPLFVTLGSTPLPDADATTRTIVAAAAGHRVILHSGTAGLGRHDDTAGLGRHDDTAGLGRHDDTAGLGRGVGVDGTVHVMDTVDYAALLPHVLGVVHHGGAGTLAEVLWHGKPSVALPSFADQFFWAHRIPAVGAGPRPLPLRRLTGPLLARRLVELTSTSRYASRAAEIGAAMRQEDGPATAAAAIDAFLA